MTALPEELQSALDTALRGFPQPELARAVTRLITRYRQGVAATEPILVSPVDAAAYAGYRMPGTYAAVRAALAEVARQLPEFAPRSLVDVGGGTGTAAWAAAETWPSLTELSVLEQAPEVVALGRKLMAASARLRGTSWRRGRIDPAAEAPAADVVTLSYVLGELPEPVRAATVRWLAASARLLVLIEPGTPAGYERVLRARDELIGLGRSVVAPCPHQRDCPITPGRDWCHFSARLPRLGAHRVIKEGTLNFEDEKFSYVAVANEPAGRAANRVLRHPVKRKGLVALRLCTGADGLAEVTVSKRHGADYRAAREVGWGEEWSPAAD
ncbi:small ribosomal subunit Rsm22 family protein [Crossiella sp. SN42]|uniref:small ribosomal subunit Rsm22 family protein n=1 Tax=Crossiella sp. SN42 TaxID=2944808 RepID=UPI00207C6707|nr:small ribosomal subunit Rsm22 family protein [Crossiella sp. SN42]MCO1579165.1 small ribosomal subunit Rsm22 family protein [Crossiella sp. SN42]